MAKDCKSGNRAWRTYTTGRTWGFGSHDVNLRSCSGNVAHWCPYLLNLFTKLSHYLFCVRISLGCGRIGQMGFKTFLQAWNSQDWTDGLQEVTFRPQTHGKRKRKEKKNHSLPIWEPSREVRIRWGNLSESLPTYHLTAETGARIVLQKMLDYDSTAANTCLAFNIITTHRCAGGEYVPLMPQCFFNKQLQQWTHAFS